MLANPTCTQTLLEQIAYSISLHGKRSCNLITKIPMLDGDFSVPTNPCKHRQNTQAVEPRFLIIYTENGYIVNIGTLQTRFLITT